MRSFCSGCRPGYFSLVHRLTMQATTLLMPVVSFGIIPVAGILLVLRRSLRVRFTKVVSLLFICTFLLLFLRFATAAEPNSRATLRGLRGVEVIIEKLGEEVARAGLSESQLRTDVERQLRQANIPILTHKEALQQPGRPGLYVRLQIVSVQALKAHLLSIEVAVVQQVTLTRNATIKPVVPTWRTASIGAVGNTNVEQVREAVGQHVNHFIGAYLAVNPETKRKQEAALPNQDTETDAVPFQVPSTEQGDDRQ